MGWCIVYQDDHDFLKIFLYKKMGGVECCLVEIPIMKLLNKYASKNGRSYAEREDIKYSSNSRHRF